MTDGSYARKNVEHLTSHHPQCVSDWGKKFDRIFVEVTIFDYSGIPFR